jgi:hypothetical protein
MKIVFATLILAASLTQTAVLADGNTGIVRGTAVQELTGKPLTNAFVFWANPSGMGSTRTDDKGRFYLLNVTPGLTVIRFEHPGFMMGCLRGSVHANETVDSSVTVVPEMRVLDAFCQSLHKTAREAVEDSR